MDAHAHEHVEPRLVLTALAVTVAAAAIELGGAAGGRTLFLVADACHLLAHVGIFAVLLVPAGHRHERSEDVASSVILAIVAAIAVGITVASIRDLAHRPAEPADPSFMLLTLVGLAANLVTAWLFADPARTRWSFRAALAHELADGSLTIAGLVGAGAIALFGWTWVDPALSLAIAVWLGAWAGHLLVRRARLGRAAWAIEKTG